MTKAESEQAFVARTARARTEREVAAAFMDGARDLFRSPTALVGFYLLGDAQRGTQIHTRGVKAAFVDEYEAFGREGDPVLADVLRRRVPVGARVSDLRPRSSDGYREFAARWECAQYLLIPIVVAGAVVGTMNMAHAGSHAFQPSDLRRATRIAMEVSSRVAVLRALAEDPRAGWQGRLSSRQIEVAEAATRGFSVVDMGRALGVSPNTIKKHLKGIYQALGVSTRAELSRTFVHGPPKTEPADLASPPAREPSTAQGAVAFEW